LTAFTPYKER